MIKMNYPEKITLLACIQSILPLGKQYHHHGRRTSTSTTIDEPTQVAHQNNRDKAIRTNKCTFLLRIHLLPPLPRILTEDVQGVYSVPAAHDVNDLRRLAAFLTNDVKAQCKGGGVMCVAYEPHADYTRVILRGYERGYDLTVPWRAMLHRCELEDKAVLSMWGFYHEEGMPRFIFRHDGYAGLGEELPPLTDMNVVDPEPVQDDQVQFVQVQDDQVQDNQEQGVQVN